VRHVSLYGEQREAIEKMETAIKRAVWQDETGLPPIAMIVPPLDHTQGGRNA